MWGNKRGWIIAGTMLVAMLVTLVWAYVVSSRRTEATEFSRDPANLAEIELPGDPAGLLPTQSQSGDARDLYWDAIDDFRKNTEDYERVARAFDLKKALALDGVTAVTGAADYRRATLFDGRAEAAVGYGNRPGVAALHQIGAICARIGTEYANRKQYDDARRYLKATFVLGYHLYQERMTRLQLSASLGLMAQSARILSQIATANGDKAGLEKYDQFYEQYQKYYRERIEPMERVLTSVDPKVQTTHAGDIFVLLDNSSERVWRVEAVLKLGIMKYFHNTAGDRRAAKQAIRDHLRDADPAVAAAALAANELTELQYRTLGAR